LNYTTEVKCTAQQNGRGAIELNYSSIPIVLGCFGKADAATRAAWRRIRLAKTPPFFPFPSLFMIQFKV
jgi:hypothetical protein